MRLYKNVDICDLHSIWQKGILSMQECRNNKWDGNRRSDNSTSIVYLFDPISERNSFPESYGAALLEVNCKAVENQMAENDAHKYDYREYTTPRVLKSQINRIIIPEIFKPYVDVPEQIHITWCELKAKHYCNSELVECNPDVLMQFARTAPLMDSGAYNFFRGTDANGYIKDLYEFQYVF